ncbi:MAG: HAD-IIB family hydrolase [Desulfobacteraceae bacterium]|nr:HAD-IIB family hydrolase [Desulfobacteraceae bacterium]
MPENEKQIYIQMFSIHGLVRFENPELGRDADTGGQVLYVVELAKHLSQRPEIRKVDLFTRLVDDPRVSDDYARPVENYNDKCRIVRIQCGGRKYFRKELLWQYLDEYIDKTIKFIKKENDCPDLFHGHYPDAGYVAMNLAEIYDVPFIFTGHSMGIPKKQKLIADGMKESEIVKKYKIDTRIDVEERILKNADLIITSTNHEIEDQYGSYENSNFPDYRVIPPGIDVERFHPYYHDRLPETEKSELAKYAQANMLAQLERFLMYPDKPLILALSRPDKRKNISGLIQAYGEDRELQAMANLAIFAGIRKDINEMEENEKDVLTRMLLMMDRYDLYGKMAIPKKHDPEYEVPELYRITAEKRGVFVNPALTEPFGLTLLEAAATGLPLVATNDGGPHDIIGNCENGIMINPNNPAEIAEAIRQILIDEQLWQEYSKKGIMNVRNYYTWESHAQTYTEEIRPIIEQTAAARPPAEEAGKAVGKRLTGIQQFLVSDIDNTLICDQDADRDELIRWLNDNREKIGFGVATGRRADSAVNILEEYGFPRPDVVISDVGTEIYYGEELHYDQGWDSHIASRWDREKILELLSQFDFLELQEKAAQRKFKISYNMEPGKDRIAKIHNTLSANKLRYTLIYSHERYLDIIPYRASKGKAIRYLSYKWELPLQSFLVSGDSGNDEEMLRGEQLGVVVGNYSPELENLKGANKVYFSKKQCAGGILEGIRKYSFITNNPG